MKTQTNNIWAGVRDAIDKATEGLSPDDERSLLEAVVMFCESKIEGLDEEAEE